VPTHSYVAPTLLAHVCGRRQVANRRAPLRRVPDLRGRAGIGALLGQANLLPSIVSATTKVPPFDLVKAFMSSMNCP
jgi:hypothetical protein